MRQKKKIGHRVSSWLSFWLILSLVLANLPLSIIHAETLEETSPSTAVQETLQSTATLQSRSLEPEKPTEVKDTKESTAPSESETIAPTATGVITGSVWSDENEDGIHDADEQMLSGVEIFLVEADDKAQVVTKTFTDGAGNYEFIELTTGEYSVAVGAQTLNGTEYLAPIASLQTGKDNKFDIEESTQQFSYTKTIKAAQEVIADIDAGMRVKPKIQLMSSEKYEIYDASNTLLNTQTTLKDAVDFCNNTEGTTFTIVLTADDPAQGAEAKINTNKNITLKSAGNHTITQNIENFNQDNELVKRHLVVDQGASLTVENIVLAGEGKAYNAAKWGATNGGIQLKSANLILGDGAVITKTFGNRGGAIQAENASKVVLKSDSKILSNQSSDMGGGIYASNSTVEMLDRSSVSGNIGRWYTGGIHLTNNGDSGLEKSRLTMNGGSITGNIGKNYDTGGVKVEKGSSLTMNAGSITSNIIESNGNGGGIYIADNSSVTINGGEINKNEANNGAGIYHNGTTLTMTGGKIAENTSRADGSGVYANNPFTMSNGEISTNHSSNNGGGIFMQGSTLLVTGGKINNNDAANDGGGIRSTNGAVLTITTSEVNNNTAKYGGSVSANGDSKLSFISSKILENKAEQRGGGINLDGYETILDMAGGEISSNKAVQGGGILVDKAKVEVKGVTITGNQATGNGAGSGYGGGILVEAGGKATITDSLFTKNTAYDGGGVYISENSQALSIKNTSFNENSVRHHGGGLSVNTTATTLEKVTFENNHADRHGGGIKASGSMDLTISDDSLFQANEARYGGGISANAGSKMTLNGTDVIGNRAFYLDDASVAGETSKGGDGGGINIDLANTTLKMDGGVISGNQADSSGGGIYATAHSEFTLTAVSVRKNTALSTHGGGILIKTSVGRVINSFVEENTAGVNGGGIRLEDHGALTIDDSSVSQNTAPYGGGLSANTASTITMTGVTSKISENSTTHFGGGVNIDNADTIFTMEEGTIEKNPARNGGGVFASDQAQFIMSGGKITQNTAINNGAGLYLQDTAILNVTNGTISLNEAGISGGGIFTEDYYYNSPVDADTYYKNITITSPGEVTEDNRSQAKYPVPEVINGPLKFDNNYLNDHQVNYFPDSFKIVYDPNGGGGERYEERYIKNPPAIVKIRSEEELKYTPPSSNPDFVFLYWCDDPNGQGKRYGLDGMDTITMDSDKYLYAIWGPPTTLSGTIFLDKNRNSTYDADEVLENREVTLLKYDTTADDYLPVETTFTNQEGKYYFAVVDKGSYKILVKKLDGQYGQYGFVKKGTTEISSHVNKNGQSDPITIDIETELKPILNAGYVEAIVVTGVKMTAMNWFVYITLIILLGFSAKKIIELRKNDA
ncbi:SdrD B-like domain-containing protein [Enterococcus sp. DIV0756]|uniref:SdrD B-like domain-containing protein n=1 Tax=Enterococcus sp. DIV0756 TaxID=2774636 RepID=UPI003F25AC55